MHIAYVMHGLKIMYEISKGTFKISHNILNPYTAKYEFYWIYIFVCDLRYFLIVTSFALVRRDIGMTDFFLCIIVCVR